MEYEYSIQYDPERKRFKVLRHGKKTRVIYVNPKLEACGEYIEKVKAEDAYRARKAKK